MINFITRNVYRVLVPFNALVKSNCVKLKYILIIYNLNTSDKVSMDLKGKTMDDKLMSIPNDDKQNYALCKLQYVGKTF